jgi:flagellar biosynthesis protein FlhA
MVKNKSLIQKLSLGTPLLILVMLFTIMLPMPPFLLDVMFSFNIMLSLIILLVTVYVSKPLEFNVFPTVLLIATLLRLMLNIASTRVVLLKGASGPDAAGQVIKAFGDIVVGGNFVVGAIVFGILVIINFVVITKGAGRVSEVSARFALDSMPGKQMAIDADLNAGAITQEEARERRTEVTQEADFYGSMDGASKFVRGDAIAGLMVMIINLLGGIAIGAWQNGMTLMNAMHTFSILTIGDGLAAQIPGLLLSTAAAIMVTRVNGSQDVEKMTSMQLLDNPKPLYISGGVIGVIALIPGMPHLAFLLLASLTGGLGYLATRRAERRAAEEAAPVIAEPEEDKPLDSDIDWEDVNPVEVLELQIGYRLITLIEKKNSQILLARLKGIRRKLSKELGFLIPAVHIKDSLELAPNEYKIVLQGVDTAWGDIEVEQLLAINPSNIKTKLDGRQTKDPTYGIDACWITQDKKEQAQALGFTVVDASTVVATHLNHVVRTHAHELLGHEEVQQMLERLKEASPNLVETLLSSDGVPLSTVVKVLRLLLQNDIPLIDIRSIAETLVSMAPQTRDPELLTEEVRVSLRGLILQKIAGSHKELAVAMIDPNLEQILHNSLYTDNSQEAAKNMSIEPSLADTLLTQLKDYTEQCQASGQAPILVVPPQLRIPIDRIFKPSIPALNVLSLPEVTGDRDVSVIAVIGRQQEAGA